MKKSAQNFVKIALYGVVGGEMRNVDGKPKTKWRNYCVGNRGKMGILLEAYTENMEICLLKKILFRSGMLQWEVIE